MHFSYLFEQEIADVISISKKHFNFIEKNIFELIKVTKSPLGLHIYMVGFIYVWFYWIFFFLENKKVYIKTIEKWHHLR